MSPTASEIRRSKQRARKYGNAYAFKPIRVKYPTPQELIVKDILRKNQAYFEFQPVVFCSPLERRISPDFLVISWQKRRLATPCYIEIDGNAKNLENWYQQKRIEGLKYPVIRIWNRDIERAESILDELFKSGPCNSSAHIKAARLPATL